MRQERVVGGVSCGQVLERLSDYVDGDLEPETAAKVEMHLRGCDACARFGGEFRATVRALREHLLRTRPAPAGFGERLRRALQGDRDRKA